MEDIIAFLSYKIINKEEYTISIGQILLVPTLLICAYLVTRWLIKFIAKRMIARGFDANLVHLASRIFYILAIIVLGVTALDYINVPITAFAFVSGAVAIGFGFGAQNIINNFISGWILMWEQPIRIGDLLEIGDTKGRVEAINTRSTRIRRVDGVHLLIPNSTLLENTVVNWTLLDNLARTTVRVGVAYGSPVKLVAELFLNVVLEQEGILEEPAPLIIFEDFGDNALVFDAYFWLNASMERDLRVIRSNIRFALDKVFADNNIVVAYPQRDIHVDGSLLLRRESTPKSGVHRSEK